MKETYSIMFRQILLILGMIIWTSSVGYTQYSEFGKNRVQYENFEWRYIQSSHFDVYYYSEKNYTLAVFAIESLEGAYEQLKQDFDHQINHRIKVIIYDSHNDFSQTNVVPLPLNAEGIGGVTDKYKNRITMPFMGDYSDFRRVLHHELVHAIINDMYYGGGLQGIISNNIQLYFPLWFEEGLAEYTALGWDTNTDMFIRDAVLNDYLPDIPRLSGYYAYRGGQSVWNYIAETYGKPKITEILQRIRQTRSINRTFSQALGLTLPELSKKWKSALKKRYFPEVKHRENITEIAQSLISNKSYNTSPVISPNGHYVCYLSNKGGLFNVILADAYTGKTIKKLVKGQVNVDFEELNILDPNITWSPDSKRIALSAKSKGADYIAIIDIETKKLTKMNIKNVDAIGSVAWSPNGDYITFDGNDGPWSDIFLLNIETGESINLTQDLMTDKEPTWSSDNQTIYFSSNRGNKIKVAQTYTPNELLLHPDLYQMDIYAYDIKQKTLKRITQTPLIKETQPHAFGQDYLSYISDKNGIPNIYINNLSEGSEESVTNLISGIFQFTISRNGSKIIFNSLNEGGLDIFSIDFPLQKLSKKSTELNYWAKRRAKEKLIDRVPAILYTQQLAKKDNNNITNIKSSKVEKEKPKTGVNTKNINYRNYIFNRNLLSDSTLFTTEQIYRFNPLNSKTKNGFYQPRKYKMVFTPDFSYISGSIGTYYGVSSLLQLTLSDLLGDHQLFFVFDTQLSLKYSNYGVGYGYRKHRLNIYTYISHNAIRYQTFSGETLLQRIYSGNVLLSYPINTYERVNMTFSVMNLSSNYASPDYRTVNEYRTLVFPRLSYVRDYTTIGLLYPFGGHRLSFAIAGSPPFLKSSPRFVTLFHDMRKYFHLGGLYSIAFRSIGAYSFGPDPQDFFLGGTNGWLNRSYENSYSLSSLNDVFLSYSAFPIRGYRLHTLTGRYYTLFNTELRFPIFDNIFQSILSIIPIYNITGTLFMDFGTAWGLETSQTYQIGSSNTVYELKNSPSIDFRFRHEETIYIDNETNMRISAKDADNDDYVITAQQGDLLLGVGFGIRTIILGIPLRYDLGWSFNGKTLSRKPLHYVSFGFDF